jgi:fatty-acyl-CoA synthase
VAFILRDTRPAAVVYDRGEGREPETAEKAWEAARWVPTAHQGHGRVSLDGLARGFEDPPEPETEVNDDDPLLLVYLPPAADRPKAAVLTHDNILFGAIHSLLGEPLGRDAKSLVVAPMYQIGALAASVFPIVYTGGSLVLESFYNPSRILDLIVDKGINYMFAVPTMFQMLAKAPNWDRADLSRVHYFISGGAPMPVPVIEKYQSEKGISFVQGYGMTETGRLTFLDVRDSVRKAGSVGKEVFHLTLRIVDDRFHDVPTGDVGEIVVKGPNVFSGYWERPDETKAAFSGDWFHTNDLGRRDEEGFIYLEGRKTDMIISAGRNIYPSEVERALKALEPVADAVVVGLNDPTKGQVLGAAVVVASGYEFDRQRIMAGLNERLAEYKLPKVLTVVDEIPKNPAGLIDRAAAAQMIGRPNPLER